jgi:hypothetical protein
LNSYHIQNNPGFHSSTIPPRAGALPVFPGKDLLPNAGVKASLLTAKRYHIIKGSSVSAFIMFYGLLQLFFENGDILETFF